MSRKSVHEWASSIVLMYCFCSASADNVLLWIYEVQMVHIMECEFLYEYQDDFLPFKTDTWMSTVKGKVVPVFN
jgi:hypothetical protein